MTDPADSVTIDKKLVRYLREGVRHELAANTWDLQAQLETTIDPEAFRGILACFDASRSLFEYVGFVDEPEPADLVIDLSRWPQLVLRVLEARHAAEVLRLQDAAASDIHLPLRDVPALGCLVSEIRKKTGAPPRARRRDESFLRQLARRRQSRRRGDGS